MKIVNVSVSILISLSLTLSACQQGNNSQSNSEEGKDGSEHSEYKTAGREADDQSGEYTPLNARPNERQMKYDLIGHTLSEGPVEGYHTPEWTYTIEEGSVKRLQIVDVLVSDDSQYVVVAKIDLKGSSSPNCNFYYDTKAKIRYVNLPEKGWTPDYITSLGMNIVADGQYDDAIVAALEDDGWGGVDMLGLRNLSECSLIVGGVFYANGEWHKFSQLIPAHESGGVGGTFGGGSVTDYRIDFVVREN